MDRNTFWSHTAPSCEPIKSGEPYENDNVCSLIDNDREPFSRISSSNTHYHIESGCSDEQPSITVRVFHTIDIEHEDQREKRFKWLNTK
jgi:hypothetical protein